MEMESSQVHRRGRFNLLRHAALVLSIGALMLTAGCKIGPNYKPMTPAIPEKWRESGQAPFAGEPSDKAEWWKSFKDAALDALIGEAFSQNVTLQAASLRIVEARIGKVVAAELLFPAAVASGAFAHVHFSQTVKPDVEVSLPDVTVNIPPRLGERLGNLVHVSGKPSVSITPALGVYSAGFDALWELDIWGGKRRRIESANASIEAAFAGYDDIMVSLAGEVAATYIQLRVLEQRLVVMRQNVEAMKKFQVIAEDRFARKESPETDVQLAKTLVAIIEVGIPALENALRQTENALCVLLGKAPQDLRRELGDAAAIPTVGPNIAVGVPADLLRRRPDVRAAERLAQAQCARIGVRKAAILPSFSLIGALNYTSTDSDRLFDPKSRGGAYGGVLGVTGLVNYPFTIERVRMEDAQFEEAMLAHKAAVLNAAREVENAMTGFVKGHDAVRILTEGSQAAARSAELAVGAYQQGKVIVSVPLVALGFQASLQDQLLAAQGGVTTSAVAMYKALGGGWENRQGQELIPQEIRDRMKDRTDWWSFAGKYDLSTQQVAPPATQE